MRLLKQRRALRTREFLDKFTYYKITSDHTGANARYEKKHANWQKSQQHLERKLWSSLQNNLKRALFCCKILKIWLENCEMYVKSSEAATEHWNSRCILEIYSNSLLAWVFNFHPH